jgi:TP901 family phage tail tape measure protein
LATIEKLLVGLGLDASGYGSGISSATNITNNFIGVIDGSLVSSLAHVTTIAEGMANGVSTAFHIIESAVDTLNEKIVEPAAQYQQSMNILAATNKDAAANIDALDAKAIALGNDLTLPATSAKDASDAMTEMVQRGVSVKDTFDGVKGVLQLSAAANISNAESAEIVASSLNTFHQAGSQAAHDADVLANASANSGAKIVDLAHGVQQAGAVAQAMGLSFDQTTTALAEMAKQGIKGSDAGTSLKSMLLAITSPSDKAREVMDQYGISIYDAAGKMRPFPDIIEQFSKMNVGMTTTLYASSAELDKIAKKADDARDKITKLTESNSKLASDMAENAAKLPAAIEAFTTRQTQAQQDYYAKLSSLETNANNSRTDAATDLAQRLQSLAETHENKLTDIISSGTQKRIDIDANYGQKLAALTTSNQDAIDNIIESYHDKQTDAQSNYNDALSKLADSYQQKTEATQQDIATLADQYQQDQISRATAYAHKIYDIGVDLQRKQRDLTQSAELNAQDRSINHQRKLTDIEQNYQNKVVDLNTEMNAATTGLQRHAIQLKLDAAKEARDQSIRDENENYQQSTDDAQRHLDFQLAQAQEASDDKAKDAKDAADQANSDAANQYQAKQDALQNELKVEAEAYDKSRQQALDNYNAALAELKTQNDRALREQQEHYDNQQRDAATAYNQQLTDLTSVLALQTQTENTAYGRSQQQAREAYDQKLADIQTALARQTAVQDAEYTKQNDRAKAAFDASYSDLVASVNKRQAEMQTEYDKNSAALATAQSALTGYDQTLQTHGAHTATITEQMHQQAAATIFGSDGIRAYNAVITSGLPAYDSMSQSLAVQGTAANLAEARMRGLSGASEGLNSTLETLALELGKPLMEPLRQGALLLNDALLILAPHLKDFVDTVVAPGITKIVDFGRAFLDAKDKPAFLKNAITDAITTIQTFISDHLPEWKSKLGQWAQAAIDWLVTNGPGIAKGVDTYAGQVLDAILKKVPDVIDWFTGWVNSFTEWLKKPDAKPGVNTYTSKIQQAITDNLPKITASGLGLAFALVDAFITGIIPYIGQRWPEWVASFFGYIVDLANKARTDGSVGAAIIDGIRGGLSGARDSFFAYLNTLSQSIIDGFKKAFGIASPSTVMATMGGYLLDGLWQGMSNALGRVLGLATTIGMNIKDKLGEWYGGISGVGQNLVDGLWNGIRTAWSTFISNFQGLVNMLPQSVRDILGIHSPSTVMDGLGQNTGQGLVNGAMRLLGAAKNAGVSLGNALAGGIGDASQNGIQTAGTSTNANINSNVASSNNKQPDIVEISLTDFNKMAEALRQYFITLKRTQGSTGF